MTEHITPGLPIITREDRNAIVLVQPGKRGGRVLVIRSGLRVDYAAPVEHVTRTTLQTVVDPGTASTVLDYMAAVTA